MIGHSCKRFLATDSDGFPKTGLDRYDPQITLDTTAEALKTIKNTHVLFRVHHVAEHRQYLDDWLAKAATQTTQGMQPQRNRLISITDC